MPTINFSFKDMQNLLGRKIKIEELSAILPYCKAELENYDKVEDVVTVGLQDTNLPFLWSAEGIARTLKGALGIEMGLPLMKIKKGDYVVNVDKNVKSIRPFLFAFVAKGKKIDDYLLKQLIQLQEKVCESFGRKRKAVSIGVYSYKNIQFPVFYKAVEPKSVKFVPLEFKERLDLNQILQRHPKGKEYSWILDGLDKYPIFIDSKNDVLSFPPIINSDFLGKVMEGDSELFIEVTGTDFEMVRLANNILAHAISDRGFDIYSVTVKYPDKKVVSPDNGSEKVKLSAKNVEKLIGILPNEQEMKKFIEKARFSYSNGTVSVPSYRRDILHWVDVAEDFAIMYGYDNVKALPLATYTSGKTFEIVQFADKLREILVGQGHQEVFSPILNTKQVLSKKMLSQDDEIVEIENPMSDSYSAVRNWLAPIMLDVFRKNKHVEYPQKIFEQGVVTTKSGDRESLACASCHKNAGFTEIKQVLESTLRCLGVSCEILGAEHPSFIEGRVGKILINKKEVGIIGEVSPQVLINFEIGYPVAIFEIDITEAFSALR